MKPALLPETGQRLNCCPAGRQLQARGRTTSQVHDLYDINAADVVAWKRDG
jgi:hypothetical protein